MKFLILLVLTIVVTAATAMTLKDQKLLDDEWLKFKEFHNKNYDKFTETIRRRIWEDNLFFIRKHNLEQSRGLHTFTVGMNKFGDLTLREFAELYNRYNSTKIRKLKGSGSLFMPPLNMSPIPKAVDWRTRGYVTPVKNQGQCGSCWSFSTTGSVEGQHMRKTKKLVSLSEQQLVDCSKKFGNYGCQGGLMDNAFKYIKANGGIDTESSYPYLGTDSNPCKYNPATRGATVSGFVDIRHGSEQDLTKALATVGPVSVAIDASHQSFQFYKDGVYNEPGCSTENLDHGVLTVGYGTTYSEGDYYWVKNSWGIRWGIKGYIKMSRNRHNQCGIASSASYPLV